MFDTDKINVQVPSGPYPRCECATSAETICPGHLLPHVEPATVVAGPPACAGPGMIAEGTQFWKPGTAILFWKCSSCGRRV